MMPHPAQLIEHREYVEDMLRAAIEYGWQLGRAGLDKPDPLFDWTPGYPLIVADGSEPGVEP